MKRVSLRLPDEFHKKLRWLAFKESRSQHSIIIEVLQKLLVSVELPEDHKD